MAPEERLRSMEKKKESSDAFIHFFKETSVDPSEMNPVLEDKKSSLMKQSDKMYKVFSRPNITMEDMMKIGEVRNYVAENNLDKDVMEQTEIQVKYSGYIEKEKNNADKLNRLEDITIPANFDYDKLKSLSFEAREKLKSIRPATLPRHLV